MLRLLLGTLGLLETLYPKRYMRVLTRLSYDYEGDPPTVKPWVVKAAQLEGVLILGAVVWSTLKSDWSCSLCRSGSDDGDSADNHNSDDESSGKDDTDSPDSE